MAYTTIDDPTLYFSSTIWTGNGSDDRNIVIDGTGMQPDFLWIKSRNDTDNHRLVDSVRGATKHLESDGNGAEQTSSNVKAFTSTGVTLSNNGSVNANSELYVGWSWKESATAGFDIVTYTGNQTARTISHNLGAVPKMMIVKTRSTTGNWGVYHVGLGTANKRLELDGNAAEDTGTSVWNDTDPTSSVFSVGNNDRITNGNGMTYVAYLFADVKGYSKFGSYTGNGNADGPFVYLGFKPRFVMTKRTDNTSDWVLMDSKRNPSNVMDTDLFANGTDEDTTASNYSVDFLSNGWKFRGTSGGKNASGGTYIFMAFAEQPFVTSTGVPATAR